MSTLRIRRPVDLDQKLPAGERWAEEQNPEVLNSMVILDGNSQVGLHNPMKIPLLTEVNRARCRARSVR